MREYVKGEKFLVKDDFKTLCCDTIIKVGWVVDIWEQTSKNRLMIGTAPHGGLHKVKRSTFNRCTEVISE